MAIGTGAAALSLIQQNNGTKTSQNPKNNEVLGRSMSRAQSSAVQASQRRNEGMIGSIAVNVASNVATTVTQTISRAVSSIDRGRSESSSARNRRPSVPTATTFRRESFMKMGLLDIDDDQLHIPKDPIKSPLKGETNRGIGHVLAAGNQWLPRMLYLTQDKLAWTHEGNFDCLVDYVLYVDILIAERIPHRPGDTIIPELASQALTVSAKVGYATAGHQQSVIDDFGRHPGTWNSLENQGGKTQEEANFFGFQIITSDGGMNGGRTYLFEVDSEEELEKWISAIDSAKRSQLSRVERETMKPFNRLQLQASRIFLSTPVSFFFAFLILGNFIVNMAEAQLVPETDSQKNIFKYIDWAFTAIFALELGVNMFSHLWEQFWADSWNTFDFVVVIISVCAVFFEDLPILSSLRLLRVFRVLRLFRKLKSLRIITNAILASLLPVLDAVIILLVVTAVYAILGVEIYGPVAEEFSDFIHSMFSMYQVATGDSWASAIARKLFAHEDVETVGVMAFFTSYTIITAMILLNVVVAVLLDNFTRSIVEEESFDHTPWDTAHLSSPLDPLLRHLCLVESEEGVTELINQIFHNIDTDGSNSAGFTEFRSGLSKLLIWPQVHVTADEYKHLVENNPGTDEYGQFTNEGFQQLLRSEMTRYCKRILIKSVVKGNDESDSSRIMIALRRLIDHAEYKPPVKEENLSNHNDSSCSAPKDELMYGSGPCPTCGRKNSSADDYIQFLKEKGYQAGKAGNPDLKQQTPRNPQMNTPEDKLWTGDNGQLPETGGQNRKLNRVTVEIPLVPHTTPRKNDIQYSVLEEEMVSGVSSPKNVAGEPLLPRKPSPSKPLSTSGPQLLSPVNESTHSTDYSTSSLTTGNLAEVAGATDTVPLQRKPRGSGATRAPAENGISVTNLAAAETPVRLRPDPNGVNNGSEFWF